MEDVIWDDFVVMAIGELDGDDVLGNRSII